MTMTTAQIALADLVATMTKIEQLCAQPGQLDDRTDRIVASLEDRRSSLERQLMDEVKDKLGVDYGVLWFAVTPA